MTVIKIIRFLQMFTYLVVVSQLMYYVFVMGTALQKVGINNFLELRKVVDPLVQQRHVPFYYAAILLLVLLILLTLKQWNSFRFITTVVALLCLVADIMMGLRESNQLNQVVNQYAFTPHPVDWEQLRIDWINKITIRGWISMTGFMALVAGLIWKSS
ncbi:MAG: hypothetical protein ACXWB9_06620 [Flavisolibacter sp.]